MDVHCAVASPSPFFAREQCYLAAGYHRNPGLRIHDTKFLGRPAVRAKHVLDISPVKHFTGDRFDIFPVFQNGRWECALAKTVRGMLGGGGLVSGQEETPEAHHEEENEAVGGGPETPEAHREEEKEAVGGGPDKFVWKPEQRR